MNFGFPILDFGLAKKGVRQALRIEYLFWNNRKSKTCAELTRSIQNRKLVGIIALVLTFAMCGDVAHAQQSGKMSRLRSCFMVLGINRTSNPFSKDSVISGISKGKTLLWNTATQRESLIVLPLSQPIWSGFQSMSS
jgi:hypothetical protein